MMQAVADSVDPAVAGALLDTLSAATRMTFRDAVFRVSEQLDRPKEQVADVLRVLMDSGRVLLAPDWKLEVAAA